MRIFGRKTWFRVETAAILGVLSLIFPVQDAVAQSDDYFWNRAEKESLSMSVDWVGIRFSPDVSDMERQIFLEENLGFQKQPLRF